MGPGRLLRRMAKALAAGDEAPPFSAMGSDGRLHTLADYAGRAFVVYFYPADETPGCVAQACAIRDAWDDFRALDLPVLGVSRDSVERHRGFVESRRLPFVLLADRDGSMHRDYGATMLGGLVRRVSYLVDAQGRIAAAFDSHLRPAAHAAKMLAAANSLSPLGR